MMLLKFILKPAVKKLKSLYYSLLLIIINKSLDLGSHLQVTFHQNLLIGKNVTIGDHVTVRCTKNATVTLGNQVKIGQGCSLHSFGKNKIVIEEGTSLNGDCLIKGNVHIGKWCLFASNIFVSSHAHVFKEKPFLPIRDQDEQFFEINNPKNHITIEDDCWLGWGVVVREGVRIGKGSIIGANSVVVSDIPPYSIVGGIPAKIIKNRLDLKNLTSISASNDEERLYFWKGFKTRQNEIKNSSVVMEKSGTVMIALEENKTLQIKSMSTIAQRLQIKINDMNIDQTVNIEKGENLLQLPITSKSSIKSSQWLELICDQPETFMVVSIQS